jgi:hypothetical protein
MSEDDTQEEKPVGRLTGKTTTYSVTVVFEGPSVERNNYLVLYGEKDEEGKKQYYVMYITDMWTDEKGRMAKLGALGERPTKPFEIGSDVFMAREEQISKILGIFNPPEESLSLGNFIGYPYEVYLLIKNFGRIFITGKSGSGKSCTMGVLCEEFFKKGVPVVILDRQSSYPQNLRFPT